MLSAALRRLYRLPLLAGLLFGGLAIVLTIFPWIDARARERTVAAWSRLLIICCGARVNQVVAPGALPLDRQVGGRLLLLNHVSWLDIFSIDSIAPASFVAKAEIARWPLAGTLVARTGTVFIQRGRRHAVQDVVRQLAAKMRDGRRAAVFPEGTTSDGQRILPFHGSVIESAREAAVPVVPIGVRYTDRQGRPTPASLYVGDVTFLHSLWRVTGNSLLCIELHVLPAIEPSQGLSRQEIARRARHAIASQLDLPLDELVPENLQRARASIVG